jgi:hypothetical protein
MTRQTLSSNRKSIGEDSKQVRISSVIIKGLLLFVIINLIYAAWANDSIGKLSLYNNIFPGRLRFPFGENPAEAYNFSLLNLDAMFASHIISGRERSQDEYRIILIGDSSTWGILLRPEETLAGLINAKDTQCGTKTIRAYNLGYPTLSLTKDILLMEQAMQYDPDLIIWSVTLEAFPIGKQLKSPLVENNLDRIIQLKETYDLQIDIPILDDPYSSFLKKSIIGQRRNLADLLRLQLYGGMWAATGIDQVYPSNFDHAQIDLEKDDTFDGWSPRILAKEDLSFNILETGAKIAGNIPVLLLNEPILISNGVNSDIRYNFYYPRWVYDQYRVLLDNYIEGTSIQYLDLWDIVPKSEFTNSAIHLTPIGEKILADQVINFVMTDICP